MYYYKYINIGRFDFVTGQMRVMIIKDNRKHESMRE